MPREKEESSATGPVSVVMPAYNEEGCIGGVVRSLREALADTEHEILVVDDGSTDGTRARAEEAGARVLVHHKNRGYGASLKMGIRHARCEWVLLMDSDGQHRPEDARRLLHARREGFDTAIGVRSRDSFRYAARMPGKLLLQWVARYLVGERPPDVNSGLRVFRKADAIPYFPILPNGFSFTTTLTLAMIKDGYEIGWIPIQTEKRQGRASNVRLRDGINTLLLILRIATLFNPLRVFFPIAFFLVGLGVAYTVWNLFREFNIPDGAGVLILSGAIVFFFGVLADQLSSLRRGG